MAEIPKDGCFTEMDKHMARLNRMTNQKKSSNDLLNYTLGVDTNEKATIKLAVTTT